jgi:hypothetical protein
MEKSDERNVAHRGSWMRISLNARVRVTLTERGLAVFRLEHPTGNPPKVWMLWDLMNVFGHVMTIGVLPPVFEDNEIEIVDP